MNLTSDGGCTHNATLGSVGEAQQIDLVAGTVRGSLALVKEEQAAREGRCRRHNLDRGW